MTSNTGSDQSPIHPIQVCGAAPAEHFATKRPTEKRGPAGNREKRERRPYPAKLLAPGHLEIFFPDLLFGKIADFSLLRVVFGKGDIRGVLRLGAVRLGPYGPYGVTPSHGGIFTIIRRA